MHHFITYTLLLFTLFSCNNKSVDVSSEKWETEPIYANEDSAKVIGCRVVAHTGDSFNGLFPTSIEGQDIIEIISLEHAKSLFLNPNDSNLISLDFSLAHHLRVIKDDAFYGLKHVKHIILNDNLERLENGAFADCRQIESIAWGKKINYIGEAVFYNCDQLITLTVPENVDTIADYAFYASGAIEEVIFNDKLSYIGERAFANCTQVKAINLPKNLTFIGEKAFLNHNLITSLSIPAKVDSIENKAFQNCKRLNQLTLKNKNGTKIGPKTFLLSGISLSEEAIIYYPKEVNYPEMPNWNTMAARWLAQ